MFQRKRRFRRRSNGRNHSHHSNGSQPRIRPISFSNSNDHKRNIFRSSSLSAEKLFEKYSSLAKEAISSGDKTLSENYLQHADHFMRIIEDKNRMRNQDKNNANIKTAPEDKTVSENTNANQDQSIKNKD
tara:strand:+ start:1118 stop:1507 length:390 start_codon:yes stop_codon:yes gene_type:complete